MTRLRSRMSAGIRLLPTLVVGACAGALAFRLEIPLPWLLGALVATTGLSFAGVRLAPPRASRRLVLVVIGVMLGTAFTPDIAGDVRRWAGSLLVMLISTALMMAVSLWIGRRLAGYSRDTAFYAGMPGGLSVVTLMAAESGADVRVVGLTHAVRVLVLLLAIPPLLQLFGHVSMQAGKPAPEQWLLLPSTADAVILVGAGVTGVWLGRRLHLPNPLLFGPVLVSGSLHLSGVTDASVPPLIVALAQIIIGASIGVRFAGTSLAQVGRTLAIALLQAFAAMLIAVATAGVGHLVSGYPPAAVLLAYMPGGAPELSLVALALGVEPAFVTAHHLLRITLLILLLPALVRLWGRLSQR